MPVVWGLSNPAIAIREATHIQVADESAHHLSAEVGNDGVQGPLQRGRKRPEVFLEITLAHQRQRREPLSKGHVVPSLGRWVGKKNASAGETGQKQPKREKQQQQFRCFVKPNR